MTVTHTEKSQKPRRRRRKSTHTFSSLESWESYTASSSSSSSSSSLTSLIDRVTRSYSRTTLNDVDIDALTSENDGIANDLIHKSESYVKQNEANLNENLLNMAKESLELYLIEKKLVLSDADVDDAAQSTPTIITRDELKRFFRSRLNASKRDLEKVLEKFKLTGHYLIKYEILYDLIEYYIRDSLFDDIQKRIELYRKLKENIREDQNSIISVNSRERFKSAHKTDEDIMKEYEQKYVTMSEFNMLEQELNDINVKLAELNSTIIVLLNKFNDRIDDG
jgi:hypothetical protein